MRPLLYRTVAVLGVLLVTSGCGGTDATPAQWTDRMCGAALPFVRTATTPPPPGADPAATAREISGYLGRTVTALDEALGAVERLGPPPVDGGDAVASEVRSSLIGIRTAFTTSRSRVDALSADPATIEQRLPDALAPVSRLGEAAGPLSAVVRNPQLGEAARNSATCDELGAVSRAAQDARRAPDAAPGPPAADGGQPAGN